MTQMIRYSEVQDPNSFAPITYQGMRILWDAVTTNLEQPQYIEIDPWVWRRLKKTLKMSRRRDKRRKHKRYS